MNTITKLLKIGSLTLSLAILLVACSKNGDSDSTMGPEQIEEPQDVFDDVTFTFQTLKVVDDCDFGSKGSGDFYYDFYVERSDATGNWTEFAYWSADNVKVSFGETHAFSGLTKTVRVKRNAHQSLRVRMFLKEEDNLATDLDVSKTVSHEETSGWLPGTQIWNIKTRVASFLISGCEMTLTYTTTVSRVQ